MSADYKKMHMCLAAAVDDALTALEHGNPAQAQRVLQAAALKSEDIYIDTAEPETDAE